MGCAELEVADVFRRHGATYRQAQAGTLGRARLRVMRAIELCRTAALGGHVEQCDACAHRRVAYNSCRNRHCPKCQALARALWLEARKADLATRNDETRAEAQKVAERLDGQSFVIIRSASDAGALYGSVTPRDVAEAATA